MPKRLLKQTKFSKGFRNHERAFVAREFKSVGVLTGANSNKMPTLVRLLDSGNLGITKLLTQISTQDGIYKLVRDRSKDRTQVMGRYRKRFFVFSIVEETTPDSSVGEMVVRRFEQPVGEDTYCIYRLEYDGEVLYDMTTVAH